MPTKVKDQTFQKGGGHDVADRIELVGLEAYGYHGVFDFEKEKGQKFLTDIVVWTDFATSAETDSIEDTTSYVDLATIAVDTVQGESFDLIETLAATIADQIIELPGIHAVEITVHKPYAPIDHPFADVRVVARRSQKTARAATKSSAPQAAKPSQAGQQ